jgi:hypothetical protein
VVPVAVIARWREVTIAAMECRTAPEAAADKGRSRTEATSAAERWRCGPEASATAASSKCGHATAAKSAAASTMKRMTPAAPTTTTKTSASTSTRCATATATSAAMLDLRDQGVIRLLRRWRRAGIDQRYRARRWCERHHHRGCGGDAERAHDQLLETCLSEARACCEALNICHWKHPPSINVAYGTLKAH